MCCSRVLGDTVLSPSFLKERSHLAAVCWRFSKFSAQSVRSLTSVRSPSQYGGVEHCVDQVALPSLPARVAWSKVPRLSYPPGSRVPRYQGDVTASNEVYEGDSQLVDGGSQSLVWRWSRILNPWILGVATGL